MMMDSLFGVVGAGFAVAAAGTSAARSSPAFSNADADRVSRIDSHMLLGVSGLAADRLRVRKELEASVGQGKIGAAAAAADVAREAVLAYAHSANAMLAGYDAATGGEGPSLYAVGSAAPPQRVEHGAAGCGSSLCAPVMEAHYRPGMTVKEAVALVDRCIKEVRRLGLATFVIMIVDKDGAREYARRIKRKKAEKHNLETDMHCSKNIT